MADFVTVGKTDELRDGEIKAYQVGGEDIAVARIGDQYYAFGDTCTHAQCSLADGDLEDHTVICACHGSEFDVTSGQVLGPPADEPVPSYPVRVEGDHLQIRV